MESPWQLHSTLPLSILERIIEADYCRVGVGQGGAWLDTGQQTHIWPVAFTCQVGKWWQGWEGRGGVWRRIRFSLLRIWARRIGRSFQVGVESIMEEKPWDRTACHRGIARWKPWGRRPQREAKMPGGRNHVTQGEHIRKRRWSQGTLSLWWFSSISSSLCWILTTQPSCLNIQSANTLWWRRKEHHREWFVSWEISVFLALSWW